MMRNKYVGILVVLSVIYAALFFTLRVLQYKSFFSFEYEDEARVNQTVYNIATKFAPHQTVYQAGTPKFLNDRFAPIYFVVALFYKIHPHIYTWYFLMCVLYGFSSIIIFMIAHDASKNERFAFFVALVYLLYPPLHYVTLGVIDQRNFIIPFLFGAFYFLYRKNFLPYLIFIVLSCFCNEDIPAYVIGVGIYLAFKRYPRKWWITTILFSILYFVFAAVISDRFCRIQHVAIPNPEDFDYIDIATLKGIVTFLFLKTSHSLPWIFSWFKVRFFMMLLYPLLFLPLLSGEIFIALPIMVLEAGIPEGFFNQNSDYAAIMIPFVFVSFIMSFQRYAWMRRHERNILVFVLIVCSGGLVGRNILGCVPSESTVFRYDQMSFAYDRSFMAVRNVFDTRFFRVDEADRTAWRLIRMIPDDAAVTATGDLLVALSSRNRLYEFGLNHPKAFESEFTFQNYPNYDVDYILVNRKCLVNGMGGRYAWLYEEDLNKEIDRLQNELDFVIRKEEGSYVLLEKRKRM